MWEIVGLMTPCVAGTKLTPFRVWEQLEGRVESHASLNCPAWHLNHSKEPFCTPPPVFSMSLVSRGAVF